VTFLSCLLGPLCEKALKVSKRESSSTRPSHCRPGRNSQRVCKKTAKVRA